jgi:hypothetical protein
LAEVYRPGLPPTRSLQPIWAWLVLLTAVLLFFDIAVRRIALEPEAVQATAVKLWDRLRGRVAAPTEPQFLERLQSRKEQIGEALDKTRRFEGGDRPPEPPPGPEGTGGVPASLPRSPAPTQPGLAPQKEEEKGDFASRLMRAKKKVWEERDKGQQAPEEGAPPS